MPIQNIREFQEELRTNAELQEKLKGLKLNHEELVSFAKEAGFDFTLEELKELNSKSMAEELPLDELDKVVGGLVDASGHWLTTIAFGCEKWEATTEVWQAKKGQCGSCLHWMRSRNILSPCRVNVEQQ